jgi:ferric-chelate reductase [NAD(P)H]
MLFGCLQRLQKKTQAIMNEKALYTLNYGVYIVSAKNRDKLNGQIANVVFQVVAEPPKVAVCLNRENLTHALVSESGFFNISILGECCTMKLIGNFGFKSGRDIDKFKDCDYMIGKNGAPIVTDFAVAYLECEIENSMDLGDYTLFVGMVTGGDILQDEVPMTYSYYHRELKGKEPKAAPTYRKKE